MPVFVHCMSGKDRTGIVVGVLLILLGIPRDIIVEEYLLSDGDISKDLFTGALDGIGNPDRYFSGLDLEKIKGNLLHWFGPETR